MCVLRMPVNIVNMGKVASSPPKLLKAKGSMYFVNWCRQALLRCGGVYFSQGFYYVAHVSTRRGVLFNH